MFCRQTRRRVSNIELNNSEIIGTNLWDDPTRSSFTYLLILLKFIFSYFNNLKFNKIKLIILKKRSFRLSMTIDPLS